MVSSRTALLSTRQSLKLLLWVWRDGVVRLRNSSTAILGSSLAGLPSAGDEEDEEDE